MATESEGISSIHEEASSKKPGDTITKAVAHTAVMKSLISRTSRKNAARSKMENKRVRRRGTKIEPGIQVIKWLTRRVCSGGWSFQTSVYSL
jgi:hypothetical protein